MTCQQCGSWFTPAAAAVKLKFCTPECAEIAQRSAPRQARRPPLLAELTLHRRRAESGLSLTQREVQLLGALRALARYR